MSEIKNKKNLSQRVTDVIYDMVAMDGNLKPGDKLPNENDLAQQLGVSRTTLREAIRALVTEGVLEVRRGKGTFVSKDLQDIRSFGFKSLERTKIRLKDLYELRLLFEPQVAALASQRATEKELTRILDQGALIEQLIREGKDRVSADQEFHKAIVMATHNEFFIWLIPLINRTVSESVFLDAATGELAEDTLRDHAMIMDFLKLRDADGCRNAMDIHIRRAIHTLGLEL